MNGFELIEHAHVSRHFVVLAADHKLTIHPRSPEVKAVLDANSDKVQFALDALQWEPNDPPTSKTLAGMMEVLYASESREEGDPVGNTAEVQLLVTVQVATKGGEALGQAKAREAAKDAMLMVLRHAAGVGVEPRGLCIGIVDVEVA